MGNKWYQNIDSKKISRSRGNPKQNYDLNEPINEIMRLIDRYLGEGYI
jgi:hypothetical protein